MPGPQDNDPEFSDSDQQWLDRLTARPGRPALVRDARAVREADALRQALDAEQSRMEAEGPEMVPDAAELARQRERMRFRARREGLWDEPQAQPWWRRRAALGGLAAAVVLGVGLIPLWRAVLDPGWDEPPTMRGEYRMERIAAPRPREAAESLVQALRDAGLKPGRYRRGEIYVIDLQLAPESLEAAAAALRPLGLTPTVGLTRIAFSVDGAGLP
jgi:hypothetical protein